jgi:hypothetical protein
MLYNLAIGWVVALFELLEDQQRRRDRRDQLRDSGQVFTRCQVIPPDVYRRPDPLIYSQSYLRSLGLGVTWDNPDIALFDAATGMEVSSSALVANTEYEIRATIYNGSTDAPAIGMPVQFSFLSFGIGTPSTFIGTTTVDLPVKGAPGHPATAAIRWRTPATPGHYCIQVRLIWADDANPANNLGQENTQVRAAQSPAVFTFPVHNADVVPHTFELVADSYRLPEPISCDEFERGRRDVERRRGKGASQGRNNHSNGQEEWCRELRRRHEAGNWEIEPGWDVEIDPDMLTLGPGEADDVTVTIEPPAAFLGTEAVNINAVYETGVFAGGVTLYVTR